MGQIRNNLKKNLGYYLALRDISQKELSERLNVSQSAVTNWIKGKNSPDIEVISDLCRILDVSILDLMGMRDKEPFFNNEELEIIKKYRQLDPRGQAAVLDTLNREFSYLNDDTVYMVARSGDRGQKTLSQEESRLADEAVSELEKAVKGKHQDL